MCEVFLCFLLIQNCGHNFFKKNILSVLLENRDLDLDLHFGRRLKTVISSSSLVFKEIVILLLIFCFNKENQISNFTV